MRKKQQELAWKGELSQGEMLQSWPLMGPHLLALAGKHWSSVQRNAAGVGCSLQEAQAGEVEEAETLSAMALLSVGAEQAGPSHTPR